MSVAVAARGTRAGFTTFGLRRWGGASARALRPGRPTFRSQCAAGRVWPLPDFSLPFLGPIQRPNAAGAKVAIRLLLVLFGARPRQVRRRQRRFSCPLGAG